jgi:pilus assembly protein Flp/PilA
VIARYLRTFVLDESGPSATEYAVMLALIVVVAIAAVNTVGNSTSSIWTNDGNKINAALGPS